MPQRVMLDTNVYSDQAYRAPVQAIRGLCLCSVVVQELLVIANKQQREALCAEFLEKLKAGDGIVPNAHDWLEVGKCLARLCSERTGNEARLSTQEVRQLAKDALIARTAIQMKAILITSNINDFAKLKRFFRGLVFKSPSEFFGARPR